MIPACCALSHADAMAFRYLKSGGPGGRAVRRRMAPHVAIRLLSSKQAALRRSWCRTLHVTNKTSRDLPCI